MQVSGWTIQTKENYWFVEKRRAVLLEKEGPFYFFQLHRGPIYRVRLEFYKKEKTDFGKGMVYWSDFFQRFPMESKNLVALYEQIKANWVVKKSGQIASYAQILSEGISSEVFAIGPYYYQIFECHSRWYRRFLDSSTLIEVLPSSPSPLFSFPSWMKTQK